jgi:hypothetical protein
MPLEQVYPPESPNPFTFDPVQDLLGSGTVGEVFRVTHADFTVPKLVSSTSEAGPLSYEC